MSGGFVAGRKFLTESEYQAACEDAELVERLRKQTNFDDYASVTKLYSTLQSGEVRFNTVIGRDFDDEVFDLMRRFKKQNQKADAMSLDKAKHTKSIRKTSKTSNRTTDKSTKKTTDKSSYYLPNRTENSTTNSTTNSTNRKINRSTVDLGYTDERAVERAANELIRKANIRRRILVTLAALIAVGSLGYFLVYSKVAYTSQKAYDELASLKGTAPITEEIEQKPLFTLAEDAEIPDILDEYKNIYLKNKSIVGWLTIEDTNIDYPVMQTVDNEYYLKHDLDGKDDNNGALFMDYQCNVMFRSTNLIIYGHHMKSGKMFGNLKKYESEDYCKKHNIINFDTIYQKGTYEVMYVFHDDIKDAADVSFKYYQFIDAVSEEEFDSNMNAMAEMSMYDTGVTASYGDELLTLSTCNGNTNTARFVVVAKKIS